MVFFFLLHIKHWFSCLLDFYHNNKLNKHNSAHKPIKKEKRTHNIITKNRKVKNERCTKRYEFWIPRFTFSWLNTWRERGRVAWETDSKTSNAASSLWFTIRCLGSKIRPSLAWCLGYWISLLSNDGTPFSNQFLFSSLPQTLRSLFAHPEVKIPCQA